MAMLAKCSLPFVILCLACLSFGAQKDASRKFWVRQYGQINSMFNHKETAAFEALLAPDYYEVDQAGKKISRDDFIKNEVEPMKQASAIKSHVKVTSVSQKGDDAQVGYD